MRSANNFSERQIKLVYPPFNDGMLEFAPIKPEDGGAPTTAAVIGIFGIPPTLTNYTIPTFIKDKSNTSYRVTEICPGVFNGRKDLTGTLTFSPNLTAIGDCAFMQCEGLTDLVFSDNSENLIIDDMAFYGCYGLKGSLTLPANLTKIGMRAFWGCGGLTSVTFKSTMPPEIGDFAFALNSPNCEFICPSKESRDAYKTVLQKSLHSSCASPTTCYLTSPDETQPIILYIR
jgi:hypothetical protein